MDLQKYVEAGKAMGYTGKELEEYVSRKEKEVEEREIRRFEREAKIKEREAEIKEKEAEREAKKLSLEAEMGARKLAQEAEIKEKEAEQEARRLELQLEIAKATGGGSLPIPTSSHDSIGVKATRPKMPPFNEARDDLDAYLERFEHFATSQKWDKSTWAVTIGPLLTGKGLQVYSSMPSTEVDDYDRLKEALLRRYNFTEEGFRHKFKEAEPETSETFYQYTHRIARYFERWVTLSGCESTFEKLCEFMVKEQVLAKCSPALSIFLRERKPATLEEMVSLGEQYLEAHGGNIGKVKKVEAGQSSRRPVVPPKPNTLISNNSKATLKQEGCFICGKTNHMAKDCFFRSQLKPREKMAGVWNTGIPRGRGKSPYRDGQQNKEAHSLGKFDERGKESSASRGTREGNRSEPYEKGAACQEMKSRREAVLECVEDGQLKLANGESIPIIVGACDGHREIELDQGLPVCEGIVVSANNTKVKVLRDTGCSSVAVKSSLVKPEQLTGKDHMCMLIDGTLRRFKLAQIEIDTPFYKGEVEAMCMEKPIHDLILGNICGIRDKPDKNWGKSQEIECDLEISKAQAVTTRAQAKKEKRPTEPLKTSGDQSGVIDRKTLVKAQREDATLKRYWELAEKGEEVTTRGHQSFYVQIKDELLYRVYRKPVGNSVIEIKQVMVPQCFKTKVMKLAHESIMGGHLGMAKTEDRITSTFWWKGISGDVQRFVRSCDICQRTTPRGKVTKVPMGEMPIIDEPFKRVAIDIIGPIYPMSDRGHRWILTIIDYGTRYPEAIPLKKTETVDIAEALLEVFSRVGFPKEILSDRGVQFVSNLMEEVSRLISVKQIFTSPYNPRCNGLCEKTNAVLKSMLKKMCEERPQDWDRYLPAVLFAYREVPQASTGFAPFELLYGRQVRGPLQILKELWTGSEESEIRTTYQYVLDLQERLEQTCRVVRQNLMSAQQQQKHHYDKSSKQRTFEKGQKVLLLLPTDNNKLLLQWKGPFDVIEKVRDMDYKIQIGRKVKTFHANLLKRYYEREQEEEVQQAALAVIQDEEVTEVGVVDEEQLLELNYLDAGKETYLDVKINENLTSDQSKQMRELVYEYRDIFTERPGTTDLVEHTIELTTQQPVRVPPYPIPYAKRDIVQKEVEAMLEAGIIERAQSEYNAPIVLVQKKTGETRFCLDFRRLNDVTRFDTEPMSNIDDILAKLKGDRFFSKIDLAKGYWQCKMAEKSKPLTAFQTPTGSYQFGKLPFGLVNSGATFNRMMRKMLGKMNDTDHYVDDILTHTALWNQHLAELRRLFEKIRLANVTIRPSKCMLGYQTIEFVGHTVGTDEIKMEEEKIVKIEKAEIPTTKKQVRAFLGLTGFYRKFIQNYAEIATPLTNLTKNDRPNKVLWGEKEAVAFNTLKQKLVERPILKMPDHDKQFILRTDASDVGVGAILLQEYPEGVFPVAYASKKLLPREQNYSVIERECLAVVFGVKKFEKFLYGKEFILQTDHAPLAWLTRKKIDNARCLRWALYLQTYRFRIEIIKGKENVGADYLSRSVGKDDDQ